MNRMLTEHFSLDEMTRTDNAQFQTENRILDDAQIATLTYTAELLENVRLTLSDYFKNDFPMIIHSAYRCPALNAAIGSVPTSQHPLCEAADWVPEDETLLIESFQFLWQKVFDGTLKIGQLIHETAERGYGSTSWIHISLGAPWRSLDKCQQVLRMEHGAYTLLGKP